MLFRDVTQKTQQKKNYQVPPERPSAAPLQCEGDATPTQNLNLT